MCACFPSHHCVWVGCDLCVRVTVSVCRLSFTSLCVSVCDLCVRVTVSVCRLSFTSL